MKAIILAGGFGSRFGSITERIPKPMIKIGGKPILWHIMKIYSAYGIQDFIICGGYQVEVIKDYFLHFDSKNSDFTIDLHSHSITYHQEKEENNWRVTILDTGYRTLKGGRLKQVEPYLTEETNFLTYGDGVANIDLPALLAFHQHSQKTVTITGVKPPSRFGEMEVSHGIVTSFREKAQASQGLINGGFMVFHKKLFQFLTEKEDCDLEFDVFETLASQQEISVYEHKGEWACMDTEREMQFLNQLWNENRAFWKIWNTNSY